MVNRTKKLPKKHEGFQCFFSKGNYVAQIYVQTKSNFLGWKVKLSDVPQLDPKYTPPKTNMEPENDGF